MHIPAVRSYMPNNNAFTLIPTSGLLNANTQDHDWHEVDEYGCILVFSGWIGINTDYNYYMYLDWRVFLSSYNLLIHRHLPGPAVC